MGNESCPLSRAHRHAVCAQCTQCPLQFTFGLCWVNIVRPLSCMLILWPWQCADRSAEAEEGHRQREGVRPNTHDMLRCPPKTPGKDTPTDPERKAACGFQQRWHSQVAASNAAAAATMERNYRTSTPSVSDVLMASALCTLQGMYRKVQSPQISIRNIWFEENGRRRETSGGAVNWDGQRGMQG